MVIYNRRFLHSNPFAVVKYFYMPTYATVHSSGRLAVCADAKKYIYCFNSDREICGIIPEDSEISKGYYTAEHIVASDNGYIVHELLKNAQNTMSASERIREYDENGRFIRTIHEENNDSDVKNRQVIYITGLTYCNGTLYATRRDKNYIYLYKFARGAQKFDVIRTIAAAEVRKCLSAVYDEKRGKIIMVCKDGSVYCQDKFSFVNIHDSAKNPGSCITEAVCLSDGRVICIDVGKQAIYSLLPKMRVLVRNDDGKIERFLHITADGDFMAMCSLNEIFVINKNKVTKFNSAPYSAGFIARRTITWGCAVYCAIFCLYALVVSVCAMLRGNDAVSFKSSLKLGIIMFITASVVGIYILHSTVGLGERSLMSMLTKITLTLAYKAPNTYGDSVERFSQPSHYGNEDWRNMVAHLDKAMQSNKSVINMYYNIHKPYRGVFCYVLDYGDYECALVPYYTDEDTLLKKVMSDDSILTVKDEDDVDGKYRYVLAPIKNSKNKTVGVLDVGYNVNDYNMKMLGMAAQMASVMMVCIIIVLVITSQTGNITTFVSALMKKDISSCVCMNSASRTFALIQGFICAMPAAFIVQCATECFEAYQSYIMPVRNSVAVPLGAVCLSGAVSSLLALRCRAKKIMYAVGCAVMSAASFFAYYAVCGLNFIHFTAACALFGAGWGASNFTLLSSSRRERTLAKGSCLAGIMMGIAAGVQFEYLLGRSAVFVIMSALSLVMTFLVLFSLPSGAEPYSQRRKMLSCGHVGLEKFSVCAATFFCTLPFAMVRVFAVYIFPLVLSEQGTADIDIGNFFIFAATGAVFFGKAVTAAAYKVFSKNTFIVLCVVASALAMLFFAFSQDTITAFFVIFLAGIFTSAGGSASDIFENNTQKTMDFVCDALCFAFFAFSIHAADPSYSMFSAISVMLASVIWFTYYSDEASGALGMTSHETK
ncbi:MAG: hypothetical protein Q4E17_02525 [Synergistes sp.]|nr:hypothetical protein [Synergistes sp.]